MDRLGLVGHLYVLGPSVCSPFVQVLSDNFALENVYEVAAPALARREESSPACGKGQKLSIDVPSFSSVRHKTFVLSGTDLEVLIARDV